MREKRYAAPTPARAPATWTLLPHPHPLCEPSAVRYWPALLARAETLGRLPARGTKVTSRLTETDTGEHRAETPALSVTDAKAKRPDAQIEPRILNVPRAPVILRKPLPDH